MPGDSERAAGWSDREKEMREEPIKGKRVLEKVADALSQGRWVSAKRLAHIQHRFASSILVLRTGGFDGRYWVIEKQRDGTCGWEYRLTGYGEGYEPASPRCLDCGSFRVAVRDDRKVNDEEWYDESAELRKAALSRGQP